MIKQNQRIRMTITGYLTQVESDVNMYCYTDFIVETRLLEEMYINKYARRDYPFATNPFKARVMQ